ncbi:MAG TPA: DUF1329 domain-containing protein [Candidatus Acidoferrum sp.]|nr:DUF1329 domain-containing protein [Candidatus Acidoferrum sp.]
MKVKLEVVVAVAFALLFIANSPRAGVNPGDTITKDQADKVADLVSPGNLVLVKQGMTMTIVPTDRLEWPPPYKSATEKYSAQVQLAPDGTLKNYKAGLPFPLVDATDPQAALKVMWNFSYRPLYTDDAISKNVEIGSFRPGSAPADPVAHFTIGNVGFYNNTGRTEVNPIPTNPDATNAGIRYRFGAYPFLEPSEMRGFGFIRYRSLDPKIEDNSWMMNPRERRARRASSTELSDVLGIFSAGAGAQGAGAATYASNLDPDSFFGFGAKIEDFNYRFLGEKPMLAVVNAANSPAKACPTDGGRTICPENWEMRRLYVIEADAKQTSVLGSSPSIPKRIFYIDSEGWFITASDQYDHDGKLWKTIATFNAYRDRPIPSAKVAIWPFRRMFQTALVDEDVTNGFSTVALSPGFETDEHESWYINQGIATDNFFNPATMSNAAH